ncbi:MAG: Transmembrane transport protein MmpL13 [uncultured Solirubrobacteraceae bacterium]|uniref:Transmembrane transport protein MmpL13 n=1 Tax=uncultured Solirubrobacteraceae bacterium TaxID=1162706 RepID=A0A6J4TNX0_9ACTN|nr:MAG: Transmembrane transport protein MmpL13 [uncultured Solirubrobacteraceae bacterium]
MITYGALKVLAPLSRLVTTHPRRVLVATVAFLALAIAVGAPVTSRLSVDPDLDFIDPQSESNVTYDELRDAVGRGLSPGIIVLVDSGAGVRTASGAAKLRRVVAQIEADPGVGETNSALTDPRAQSPFVARDGTSSFVAVFVRAGADGEDTGLRIDKALADEPGVKVGGLAVAGPAVGDQVSEDLARAEMLAFPLLFALALVVFRGAIAALLPLFVGLLTIMTTFLGLRFFNEATSLSIFALNLAIGLGLGLAIDYSLFVLSRYREEMERDGPGRQALLRTMRTAGRTVVFSSLTVAAAMLSLLVFPQRFLYSMAISGSLTALGAGFISLTALPALLMVLGDRVDAFAPRRWRHRATPTQSGFWYRLSHAVMRRPVLVAVTTAAVLIAAGTPFTRIEFTGVDASVLPDSAQSKQVDSALRGEFPPGGTSPLQVAVTAPGSSGGELRSYAQRLAARRDVADVDPPRLVGENTWLIRVVPSAGALEKPTLDLVRAIRDGQGAEAAYPVRVAGESARFVDQRAGLANRLPLAIAVLAITTLVILFVMTGSVVLPIKALIMNVLGLSAAFGLLVFIFQDGRLEGLLDYTSQGGLEITQPLVLLAIVFGLSTDYGVFLLTRIKEARDAGASNEEAVALGIQRTGRIVTAAALLLVVAIGAFATSEIVFIKQLGVGTAAAVAIDATIVRALLVPALMKLLGERNWWAPRPLARIHARLRLGEA